ncbi:MAG: YdeI/OmpD-associated family protein [Acidimicrobiales bacterium]
MSTVREFTVTVTAHGRGSVFVPVLFDPDETWGRKATHHVAGTVNGMRVRGAVEAHEGGQGLVLGPAWRRDCGLAPGDEVRVALEPEGPQRDDLAPDMAQAFEAEPEAGQFFDSLAQFYRNAYLKWVDATKRRPEVRAARIAEMVALLKEGRKERPSPSR